MQEIRDSERKVEIEAIETHGDFARIPLSAIPGGESLLEGGFAYAVKNMPISACRAKLGHTFTKIEN